MSHSPSSNTPSSDIFPPSSDMVELTISGDKVVLYCLICAENIGDATYLNEAVLVWANHRKEKKP